MLKRTFVELMRKEEWGIFFSINLNEKTGQVIDGPRGNIGEPIVSVKEKKTQEEECTVKLGYNELG
jgi:hypothetical protein